MKTSLLVTCLLIGALTGCNSGSGSSGATANVVSNSPVVATGLSYTDPTTTGWRLVKDTSSTPIHIVLSLVGPDNLAARGVGFNLSRGACAKFGTFAAKAGTVAANSGYAFDTKVFELWGANANFEPYASTPADPVLFVSAPLKSGDVLSTGIFQKDRSWTAKNVNVPLVQVALDLDVTKAAPGTCNAGTVIALTVPKSKIIPADIGGADFQLSIDVINKAKMQDISVAVGSLKTL